MNQKINMLLCLIFLLAGCSAQSGTPEATSSEVSQALATDIRDSQISIVSIPHSGGASIPGILMNPHRAASIGRMHDISDGNLIIGGQFGGFYRWLTEGASFSSGQRQCSILLFASGFPPVTGTATVSSGNLLPSGFQEVPNFFDASLGYHLLSGPNYSFQTASLPDPKPEGSTDKWLTTITFKHRTNVPGLDPFTYEIKALSMFPVKAEAASMVNIAGGTLTNGVRTGATITTSQAALRFFWGGNNTSQQARSCEAVDFNLGQLSEQVDVDSVTLDTINVAGWAMEEHLSGGAAPTTDQIRTKL